MSKYPKYCVTNKSNIFKQNPSTKMSLNLEVNPLTTTIIELFSNKIKALKKNLWILYHLCTLQSIYINSKNSWLSYAKIQEILRALSTYIYLVIQLLLYSLWNHCWAMGWEVVGDQLKCMCYYEFVNKSLQHQSRFSKKWERMGGKAWLPKFWIL